LFAVRRRAGCTVSELAEALGQRLAATSALAGRLARAGLLRRGDDQDDRRRIRLELTDDAERMLTAVDRRSADRFAAILGRMSKRGRDALAVALTELVDLMSSDIPQVSAPGTEAGRTDKRRL
jgi:DNA-binding MarR family transcriptional regulator